MPQSSRVQRESQYALAIKALAGGTISSIRHAAHAYDVPETTLRRRVQGIAAKHTVPPAAQRLTDTEEEVLVKRIPELDDRGFPPVTE
jgi:hypothetical protein